MGSLKKSALFGLMAVFLPAASALAADMPEPPVIYPPVEVGGAWYLRGHIGMSNQAFKGLSHPLIDDTPFVEWLDKGGFDAGVIGGLGIGFRYNDNWRFDLTGEYRGKTHFAALDRYDGDNPPTFDDDNWGINDYSGKKSEWLFLANAYYDFASWGKITPYVGAGIGASYNTISNFRDNNVITGGGAYAGTGNQWNLAWALHAGLAYKASKKMTIDVGYSFVSLGDAKTGTLINYDGTCSYCAPMKFDNIYSHDFKIGLRYELGGSSYSGGWK